MKVCLITPPSPFLLDERVFMSLGILKVGASLEANGHQVEHLDLSGVSNYADVVSSHLTISSTTIFALTATTPQMPAAVQIAELIRSRGGKTILGGPHITLVNAARRVQDSSRIHAAYERLADTFDVLVAGDGEEAILQAIGIGKGLVDADNPKSPLWLTSKKFTESPWPNRELVDVESYKYSIDGERALHMVLQLGCPFACGFSLTGDSYIHSEYGWETIEHVANRLSGGAIKKCVHGGSVVSLPYKSTVSTVNGSFVASSLIVEGIRPTYKVTSTNGMSITGTAEHPLLVANDEQFSWKRIDELQKGDWLVLKQPPSTKEYVVLGEPELAIIPPGGYARKDHVTPKLLDEDLAWLIGFIIGDGCLPKANNRRIHVCVEPLLKARLVRVIKEQFNVDLRINKHNLTSRIRNGWIHSVKVYEFFKQNVGINPKDKLRVPACIFASPKSVIDAFLDGLWDADGYIQDAGNPYLTTISQTLAEQCAMLLLQCGRQPTIVTVEGRGYRIGRCFRVTWITPRIPTNKSLYKNLKSGKWHWRTPKSLDRSGVRLRTLIESGLDHPLNVAGLFYAQVKSVVENGDKPVYDLKVPDEHNFVANGFVAHNCGGRSSNMLRRVRLRTTESAVAELEHIYLKYGAKAMMINDDELNVNKECVPLMNAIADLGKKHGVEWKLRGFVKSELFTDEQAAAMYRAGFRWLLCGFEGGHPRILKNINKRATVEDNSRMMATARRHGLKVKALMSVGHPGESEETVLAVRDWLIAERVDDFDVTVITTYPGTPYYDEARDLGGGVWRYTINGDGLYMEDADFTRDAQYYKGIPGSYKSFVWTDELSQERLVKLRDQVEDEVRKRLGIPFNQTGTSVRYEASMGMLPGHILRSANQ